MLDEEAQGLVVDSHASRYGLKGDEDLGGGLKAVYKLEWGVRVSDPEGNLTKSGQANVCNPQPVPRPQGGLR